MIMKTTLPIEISILNTNIFNMITPNYSNTNDYQNKQIYELPIAKDLVMIHHYSLILYCKDQNLV